MAKLLNSTYPVPEVPKPGNKTTPQDWSDWDNKTEKMLEEIPEDRLLTFPVADGHALYYIVSISPPVLQWIPAGDAWQIPYEHIRGIRSADITRMIKNKRILSNLFGGRNE